MSVSGRRRTIQWAGLLVVAATAFWPTFHYRAFPMARAGAARTGPEVGLVSYGVEGVGAHVLGAREVPVREMGAATLEVLRGPDRLRPLWERRRWYPYALVPIWMLALGLVSFGAGRKRRRRVVGTALWILTFGLAVFEAAYLAEEYAPFLEGRAGELEAFMAWGFVLVLLFYRRRADRRLDAVEATVAAQALLAFVHALTLPATMARSWLGRYETGAVLDSVWTNFPPAFWIGCAGFLMIALPAYLWRSATESTTPG